MAWSLAAHAQESATMRATQATTATLPQIEMARVKPNQKNSTINYAPSIFWLPIAGNKIEGKHICDAGEQALAAGSCSVL
jgi:hypothetical protein